MKEKEENEASWETRFITLKNMEKWKGGNGKNGSFTSLDLFQPQIDSDRRR